MVEMQLLLAKKRSNDANRLREEGNEQTRAILEHKEGLLRGIEGLNAETVDLVRDRYHELEGLRTRDLDEQQEKLRIREKIRGIMNERESIVSLIARTQRKYDGCRESTEDERLQLLRRRREKAQTFAAKSLTQSLRRIEARQLALGLDRIGEFVRFDRRFQTVVKGVLSRQAEYQREFLRSRLLRWYR